MTICSAFVGSAIGPLFDNAVLEYLGDQKEHYGKQRLWVRLSSFPSPLLRGWDRLG